MMQIATRQRAPRVAQRGAALALLLAGLLLSACGHEERPEALTASAKQYMAKRDYVAAAIQLKNALRHKPNDGEVRYLLGVALLERRDTESAENELRKALELNYPAERVSVPLARALLEGGKSEKLIAEFGDKTLADRDAQADLLSSVGYALLAVGKPKEARAAFARALAAKPDHDQAKLGEARILGSEGEFAGASRIVEEVLAQSPAHPGAQLLKGELLIAQGRADEAIAVLTQLVAAKPNELVARQALVSLLIDKREFGRAAAELGEARKVARGDLRFDYLQAVLDLRQGKHATARDAILRVLRATPDHAPSLTVAGAIEYQAGSYLQAESYLRKALDRAPQQPFARRLLAASYLRLGNLDRAVEVLQPMLGQTDADARALQLAGEIYLAQNDLKTATQYLEQASAADAKNAAARTRLAQVRFALGDVDRAVKDLEAVLQADPDHIQADVVLVLGHLRRGNLDQALAAAKGLEQKQPKNPLTHNLVGTVHLAQREEGRARASFERALALEPGYVPALKNLAVLDVREKKSPQARKRFEAVLEKEPANTQVLLAFAELLRGSGADKKEIAAVLERAIRSDPASVAARLGMIDLLLRTGDTSKALLAAQEANAAIPNDPRLLDTLGVAQQANGDTNQAIATFQKAVATSPQSAAALVRLAAAYAAAKDYANAEQTLRKALELQPNLAELHRDIALVYLQSGRPDEALAEARAMQRQKPKEPAGYVIEGDVFSAQKRWGDAANAYRGALALAQTPAMVVRLHSALTAAGSSREAEQVARTWLKEHPKDVAVRAYLAQGDLQAKNYKSAAQHYRTILDYAPDNATALNNLAWAAGQLSDPQAIAYAEQANRLAPDNPAVMDTLGWLLVESGDLARGVDLLQKATALAPGAQEIRLHFAKALVRAGQKDAARKELEAMLKAPKPSPFKDEAAALVKSL